MNCESRKLGAPFFVVALAGWITSHGCGGDGVGSAAIVVPFAPSAELHQAELSCGETAYEEPTVVEVQAVKCSASHVRCCVPQENGRWGSWYDADTNTITLPENTSPPECASYIREHNLPCEMESAVTYQNSGVYHDRCFDRCAQGSA